MNLSRTLRVASLPILMTFVSAPSANAAEPPGYEQASAVLQKYCAGCHNADDAEGGLSVETFAAMQKGGENGPLFLPGDAKSSRMIRLLTGAAEPRMPPEDNERPNDDELQLLRDWIDAGARGPEGAEPKPMLRTPKIKSRSERTAINAAAASLDGSRIALAGFQQTRIVEPAGGKLLHTLTEGIPGKVNSVRFSKDGRLLVTASGVTGLTGVAQLWDAESGKLLRIFEGHRDVLFAAVLSPDQTLLATGSYDRKIILWDVSSGKQLRMLDGHNDAVYDLDFNADGTVLASASGDETVKLWRVADGLRLDTLGQPQGEQYVVRFSPDDSSVVAGGVDNRIRVWRFVSREKRQINPLRYARFAHEGPIVALAFSHDGTRLLSAAEDRSLKAWETDQYTQLRNYPTQPDLVTGLAVADDRQFLVARIDGSTELQPIAKASTNASNGSETKPILPPMEGMSEIAEAEPNGDEQPQSIPAPATVRGVIQGAGVDEPDVDTFRFAAKAGERWIIEVNAARSKSPLDSYLQILDADGQPVPRVKLQAVRDSYFTFRGKDSNTVDDFRLHNWEEMELNEYLYCNGEVVKLWLYPRGPDSGFKVYPGEGKRYGFFDTTPTAHALQEPCYIVEPYAPDAVIRPNGLPVFTLYYENDDDSRRRFGSDSVIHFTAPEDGDYRIRLTDVRGFSGQEFKYSLQVRPAQPDFKMSIRNQNPTVNAGGGKEFQVRVDRQDGFDGEIRVDVEGLPPGFRVTSPLVIQAGQNVAFGTIYAEADAPKPTAENAKSSRLTAVATIYGNEVRKPIGSLGEIKLADRAKVIVQLESIDQEGEESQGPLELTIRPGQTIRARVVADRKQFGGIISFGKEDSGRNLPHGVFVDNIGLNGLMMRAGQNERVFFITAAPWVPDQTRTFHLMARVEGNQTTQPVILHVKR